MIDLPFDGVSISLEDESCIRLGVDLLGRGMLLRRFAILILRWTSCIVHRGRLRSAFGWLESFCCTCWRRTYSPMVGKWCLWGGWPFLETLRGLGLPIGGRCA